MKFGYVNDFILVTVDGATYLAHRYSMVDGKTLVFEVYEPSPFMCGRPSHTTIHEHCGSWWGTLPSGPLPADLAALPGWPNDGWKERAEKVRAWRAEREAAAQRICSLAFPENAKDMLPSASGRMEVWGDLVVAV